MPTPPVYYKVTAYTIDPALAQNGIASGTQVSGSQTISTDTLLRYRIELYSDSSGLIHYLSSVVSPLVDISWAIVASTPKNISWSNYFTKDGGAWYITNKTAWHSDIQGKGQTTLSPTFTVNVEGTPATLIGSIPKPVFSLSAATKVPQIPSQITKDLTATGVQSNQSDVYYNPCPDAINDVWAVHIIKEVPTSAYTNSYYSTIKFYKKDGTKGAADITYPNYDTILRNIYPAKNPVNNPAYLKAREWLLDFKAGVFCKAVDKSSTSSTGDNNTTTVLATDSRWNPPNHSGTRGDSLIETLNGGMKNKTSRLGYIFSDTDYKLNVSMSGTSKPPVAANAKWGFRFMFNPNAITISTSINEAIDVGLAPKWDILQGGIISGNASIRIELVLSRQLDVATLDPASPERATWKTYYQDTERGYISSAEINSILTRGTEYDLEFLYRIVSAMEPDYTATLTNGEKSADWGFVTKQPFWLRLHDNMNYFVMLQNIDVVHVQFTKDMVPVLTNVTLTMSRAITPVVDMSKVDKKTITTNSTPGTGGRGGGGGMSIL